MRRTIIAVLSLAVLGLAGCRERSAPGQPLDNVTAMNTEDTGPWRVAGRTERDGRIALRVVAEVPARAERIARKALDQQLERSPKEVVVEVFAAESPQGQPVARVAWQRPARVPAVPAPATAADPRGAPASDRQGSPERTVGAEER